METIEEKDIKKIEGLLRKSNSVLIMTTSGGAVIGKKETLLDLLANIVNNLKQSGFSKEILREAFDQGLSHKEKGTEESMIETILKSELKELKSILDEFLGDDDNE